MQFNREFSPNRGNTYNLESQMNGLQLTPSHQALGRISRNITENNSQHFSVNSSEYRSIFDRNVITKNDHPSATTLASNFTGEASGSGLTDTARADTARADTARAETARADTARNRKYGEKPSCNPGNQANHTLTPETEGVRKKIIHPNNSAELDYSIELNRLSTYKCWPKKSPMNPRELVNAGFYYTGTDDMVKCFSCNGKIKDWEIGDSAIGEHKRFFPKCAFITANEKLNAAGVMNFQQGVKKHPIPQTARVVDLSTISQHRQPNRSLTRTLCPQFGSKEERLKTYENWIYGNSVASLAEAGFFSTNKDDETKCFYCGGGLRRWADEDDPWVEHAKYFPNCEWLLVKKGTSFVEQCKKLRPVNLPSVNNPVLPNPGVLNENGTAQLSIKKQNKKESENKVDLNGKSKLSIDSQIVKDVLGMGFSKDDVKRAIERQIKNGEENITVRSIIDKILAEQDTPEEPREDIQEYNVANDNKQSANFDQSSGSESNNMDESSLPVGIQNELRELRDKRTCKICMDDEINTVFVPCGHLVACTPCSEQIQECPICRMGIKSRIKTYLS